MPEDNFDNDITVRADIPEQTTVNEYRSSITIGNVETLDYGDPAYVHNSGTASDVVLDFGLPKGASGAAWGFIDGLISNQKDLQEILTSLANRITALEAAVPATGSIIASPKSSMTGWLLCNGQAVSRTTYADLFAIIGSGYGGGDGSSTFNVPDFRGCFLRGLGGSSPNQSADNVYTKQAMAAPEIYGAGYDAISAGHDVNAATASARGAFYCERPSGRVSWLTQWGEPRDNSDLASIAFKASRYNSTYGAANEVRPVNYAVNYFIKY